MWKNVTVMCAAFSLFQLLLLLLRVFFSLVWYWMRLSAVPELNFALCFYNLFHIYASFRRFDVKPCIKWPSTSIHIRSLAALFPECDTTQQRMFRLAFTSWKQFRTEGEERKNSFSSLIGLFFLFISMRFYSSFRLVFWAFSLSIEIPRILFRSLCTFIITSDTNRFFRLFWAFTYLVLFARFLSAESSFLCLTHTFR